MRLGIDLDNTLICYDELFATLAVEAGILESGEARNKQAIRDHLRAAGREDDWTRMQGLAYGTRMSDAECFPGAAKFLQQCRAQGIEWFIVSHRSQVPYLGDPVDLHESARQWLLNSGLAQPGDVNRVFLELTLSEKLDRIRRLNCEVFIDDLAEVLTHPEFPTGVRRILFDPKKQNPDRAEYERVQSWSEIGKLLDIPQVSDSAERAPRQATTSQLPQWFASTVAELLSCDVRDVKLQQLAGGANNRVFRAQYGETVRVVKWYFTDPDDSRDRFHAEWSFLCFAKGHSIDEPPRPVAVDPTKRLAVYEFIFGQKPDANIIREEHIRAALGFLSKLNQHRHTENAAYLPIGSEACFSIKQHLACISNRVERLRPASIAAGFSGAIAQRIAQIQQDLHSLWSRIEEQIRNQVILHRWSIEDELPLAEQIISPSDFGFHNALIESDGRVRFIDFEYAGWDDPAKTICDFFCQLAIPVPMSYWDSFCVAFKEIGFDNACSRAELLLPLYRLKWCCIVLNPLLRVGRNRRTFSGQDAESETYIAENCLTKAEALLCQLRWELDER